MRADCLCFKDLMKIRFKQARPNTESDKCEAANNCYTWRMKEKDISYNAGENNPEN